MEFLKKNAGLIIFVGILLIVVWYFFLRKKKAESSYRKITRVKSDGAGQRVSSVGTTIGCPEWQTWNPITKRCENRSYPDGALRVSGTSVVGTGGGVLGKTIGQPDASHGNKCYCGKDDSTPPRDVWNFACCDKATT